MMFIDGKWVESTSGRTFESTNPATGAVVGLVPDGGPEDARAAVEAAERAFGSWSRTTAYARSAILVEAHRLMLDRREELARLMTEEQGKPLRMARNEVGYAADFLLWFAEEAKRIYGETIPSARADQRFLVLHQAVGIKEHCVAIHRREMGSSYVGADLHLPQPGDRRNPRRGR